MYWPRLLSRAEEGCRGEESRQSPLKVKRPTPFFLVLLLCRYWFSGFQKSKILDFQLPIFEWISQFFFFFKKFTPWKVQSSKFQNQFQHASTSFLLFFFWILNLMGESASMVSIFCDTIKNVKVMVFWKCQRLSINILSRSLKMNLLPELPKTRIPLFWSKKEQKNGANHKSSYQNKNFEIKTLKKCRFQCQKRHQFWTFENGSNNS